MLIELSFNARFSELAEGPLKKCVKKVFIEDVKKHSMFEYGVLRVLVRQERKENID